MSKIVNNTILYPTHRLVCEKILYTMDRMLDVHDELAEHWSAKDHMKQLVSHNADGAWIVIDSINTWEMDAHCEWHSKPNVPPHKRLIMEIARDIVREWPNVNYGAKPYLQAMLTMTTVDRPYFEDSAESVVNYFLANANGFKGPLARELKQELKALLPK